MPSEGHTLRNHRRSCPLVLSVRLLLSTRFYSMSVFGEDCSCTAIGKKGMGGLWELDVNNTNGSFSKAWDGKLSF